MSCDRRSEIQSLLDGRLGSQDTLAALDHARRCEACRGLLQAAVKTAPTAAREPGTPPYARYTPEEVEAASRKGNPGLKRGYMALLMVVLLTMVPAIAMRREAPTGPSDPDVQASVQSGVPVGLRPEGEGPRPRQLRCALPSGAGGFTVRISAAGAVVWEHRFKAADPGVDIYPSSEAAGGVMAVAPFPGRDTLTLEAGAPYEYRVLVQSGAVGAPVEFSIQEPQ